MAPSRSKDQDRIAAFQAIIDNKCADRRCAMDGCRHEGEKDAARHALGRLLGKVRHTAHTANPQTAEQVINDFTQHYGWPAHAADHVYGPRYAAMRGTGIKEKAAQIKKDIMMARKIARPLKGGPLLKVSTHALAVLLDDPIGDAPEALKFSVTSEYMGSGYSVIDITVSQVPEGWGWRAVEEAEHYGGNTYYVTKYYPTRALKALAIELGRLHWAYNADRGSDLATDLNMKDYNGGVQIINPEGLLSRVEYSRTAEDVLGTV